MVDLDHPPPDAEKTRTCLIWHAGILCGQFLAGAEVSLEDAVENIAVTARLTGGKRVPVLVDLRKIRSQSAGARAYLAGPDATRVVAAVAVLVHSPVSRVIADFYLGHNRPEFPTRLFTSAREAEGWLSSFLDKGEHDPG